MFLGVSEAFRGFRAFLGGFKGLRVLGFTIWGLGFRALVLLRLRRLGFTVRVSGLG